MADNMKNTIEDLEGIINAQKEQLSRYEKRLKDVVTAYKGLLKEKEALESSLNALNASKSETSTSNSSSTSHSNDKSQVGITQNENKHQKEIVNDGSDSLQTQIFALMNSLATLSAEKSRMEASFQYDKKQLRSQLSDKEQLIDNLKLQIKDNEEAAKSKINEANEKWLIERQEREKETNNQILMIRELQKLYADERHLKENIEMQLNNFKTQFANNEAENTRLRNLQAQLKEAKQQIKQFQNNSLQHENEMNPNSDNETLLYQLQKEMQQLKEQHAIAIKNEQARVLMAEEQTRKQTALHENRVVNLEARLAELSTTVGNYHRLRQQDQESIQALKHQLYELEHLSNTTPATLHSNSKSIQQTSIFKIPESNSNNNNNNNDDDDDDGDNVTALVDQIMHLKKVLLESNSSSANPINLSKIFSINSDHICCQEELKIVTQQWEKTKKEVDTLQEKINEQSNHITILQNKVQVLNRNIEEQEQELKLNAEQLQAAGKNERIKWQERQQTMENDFRVKLNDLEQQLQLQRQRSLQLLEDKEHEIKTLQTSLDIFHSNAMNSVHLDDINSSMNSSDVESNDDLQQTTASSYKKLTRNSKLLNVGDNYHMLHYDNEIARKDIEIANLRKARYAAEMLMRKTIQEKVTLQEELNNRIIALEEQVDRLERCKTREGANLEYLKNVVIRYILSKDVNDKRHILNAIGTVLQFTPNEIQTINTGLYKK